MRLAGNKRVGESKVSLLCPFILGQIMGGERRCQRGKFETRHEGRENEGRGRDESEGRKERKGSNREKRVQGLKEYL